MIPKKSLDSVLDKSIILTKTAPNDNAKSISVQCAPGLRRSCIVDAELPQCGATSIKSEEFGESIGLRNSY